MSKKYIKISDYFNSNKQILNKTANSLNDVLCVIDPQTSYNDFNDKVFVHNCTSDLPLGITQSVVNKNTVDFAANYSQIQKSNSKISPLQAGEFTKYIVGGHKLLKGEKPWDDTSTKYCSSWNKKYNNELDTCY